MLFIIQIRKVISLLVFTVLISGCSSFTPSALNYTDIQVANKRKPIEYGIYTPPQWERSERLPLIVFLHGGGGSHESFERYAGHAKMDSLIEQGKAKRAIIVFPKGDLGFWENWADGSRNYRDWVIQDIMPAVQNEYKTLGCPEHCHLIGISMGGFGALRISNFEPELFSTISAISAPIFTRSDQRPPLLLRLLIPFKRIFGDVASKQEKSTNPYYAWVDRRLDKKMRLQLVWGNKDSKGIIRSNEDFTKRLKSHGVAYESLIYDGGHKWKYWVETFEQVMAFSLGEP